MSGSGGEANGAGGAIAYMATNGVAANLFMLAILAAGVAALTGLEREAWPVVPFNHIEVSIPWPGATPEEVEEAIVAGVEEQVGSLDNVRAVKSVAAPGIASVRIEVNSGADIDRALSDIEAAVGRVRSFPAGAERPEIREMTNRQSVMRLIVYGDIPERSLKALAYEIEDGLGALPEVSSVDTGGVRADEISIEVPMRRLRALGLTLDDIADAVRRGSLDLSAGSIDTSESLVRVRTLGQSYGQHDFEDIVVIAGNDGTRVRLGDIASVRDGFEDTDLIVRHQNLPAVFVEVFRADGEQVMAVARAVHEHIAGSVIPALPAGVGVTVWNDESQAYSERVNLLLKNGGLGLLLILVALALFLEIRLAVWVAAGLATAAIGALAVMLALDISLNTVSLFSFVLAFGIVVDDAIVVAEHIHAERMRGTPGVLAAIRGTRRIRTPLTFAVLTSVAAFVPVLFIPGGIGEVWGALPVIVIGMLLISLVESLFILPHHLSALRGPGDAAAGAAEGFLQRIQRAVDRVLNRFVQTKLDRAVRFAVDEPPITLACIAGLLLVCVAFLPAGIVATTFADPVEGDFATASLEMPDGTPAGRTYEVARELEAAGHRAIQRIEAGRGAGAVPILAGVTVTVGQRARVEGGGLVPEPTLNPQPNIATVEFKLVGAQQREISTGAVVQAWREEAGAMPHARGIAITGEVIDLGNPVEAALSHPDPDRLAGIATTVVDELRSIGGVYDVRSDHAPGVREIQLRLRPEARTLGLTLEDVARQARAAFFGAEALRVQRGREDVRVYARLPEGERGAVTDVENYLVRAPDGAEIPLRGIAALDTGTAAPAIRRLDGQRVVTVTANVDTSSISGNEANRLLEETILAELTAANPDLSYRFGGEQQQQLESLDSLYRGFALALVVIFALLAIPLRSYTKPLIVMSVVPLGLIGAILGHLILNIPMSAASFIGIFGLSGVVVNDSLVMIDFIDQRLREGASARDAIIEGAKARFRPIMLTSVTTFLGFTPLILETAIQAQFLLPFAASLGVGIVITTAILMVAVPALYALHLKVLHGRQAFI